MFYKKDEQVRSIDSYLRSMILSSLQGKRISWFYVMVGTALSP